MRWSPLRPPRLESVFSFVCRKEDEDYQWNSRAVLAAFFVEEFRNLGFIAGCAWCNTTIHNPGGSIEGTTSTCAYAGKADRKSTRLNSSHSCASRMTSSDWTKKLQRQTN